MVSKAKQSPAAVLGSDKGVVALRVYSNTTAAPQVASGNMLTPLACCCHCPCGYSFPTEFFEECVGKGHLAFDSTCLQHHDVRNGKRRRNRNLKANQFKQKRSLRKQKTSTPSYGTPRYKQTNGGAQWRVLCGTKEERGLARSSHQSPDVRTSSTRIRMFSSSSLPDGMTRT